ncbi:hypothetical protein GGI21_006182, partial [Coemansia aciculifera]
ASLPDNVSIQKEVRQSVSKASTIFVSYLAATANDCARESGHKTIMTSDVLKALEAIGLADFVDRLKADLEAFTSLTKEKKEHKSKTASGGPTVANEDGGEENDDDDDSHANDEHVDEDEAVKDAEDKDAAMDVDDDDDAADPAKRPRIE